MLLKQNHLLSLSPSRALINSDRQVEIAQTDRKSPGKGSKSKVVLPKVRGGQIQLRDHIYSNLTHESVVGALNRQKEQPVQQTQLSPAEEQLLSFLTRRPNEQEGVY